MRGGSAFSVVSAFRVYNLGYMWVDGCRLRTLGVGIWGWRLGNPGLVVGGLSPHRLGVRDQGSSRIRDQDQGTGIRVEGIVV